MFPKQSFGQLT